MILITRYMAETYPNFSSFPKLIRKMSKEEIQVLLALWEGVLKSSTVGFFGALVIFDANRSRYLCMYSRSAFASKS